MMLMMLIEVFARYVFDAPLLISTEFSGYMLVAITFIGLGYTWRKKTHVRIKFAVQLLPVKARNWLRVTTIIIAMVFTGFLIKASQGLLSYSLRYGKKSEEWLHTPLVWPQTVLLIGSVVLLLALICELVEAIRASRTPGEEAS